MIFVVVVLIILSYSSFLFVVIVGILDFHLSLWYVCSDSELAQIMEKEELGTTAKPSVGRMRPPEAEIEGFFAAAEMRERKRFMDK